MGKFYPLDASQWAAGKSGEGTGCLHQPFLSGQVKAEALPMTFTEALRHTHRDLWQRMITHLLSWS